MPKITDHGIQIFAVVGAVISNHQIFYSSMSSNKNTLSNNTLTRTFIDVKFTELYTVCDSDKLEHGY